MRHKTRTIEGEEQQLKLLKETGDGLMLSEFVNPSPDVINAALALNGLALRYLVRPIVEYQVKAIQQTIEAIEHCPSAKRGKNGPTLHAKVQQVAWEADPLCLLMFPDRFNQELEAHTRPGLLAYAANIISAWLAMDPVHSINPSDQYNMRHALRHFVYTGRERIPVWPNLKPLFFTEHDEQVYSRLEAVTEEHGERVALAILYLDCRKYPSREAWYLICTQTEDFAERMRLLTMALTEKLDNLPLPNLD